MIQKSFDSMMGTKKEIGKGVACTMMILSRDYP